MKAHKALVLAAVLLISVNTPKANAARIEPGMRTLRILILSDALPPSNDPMIAPIGSKLINNPIKGISHIYAWRYDYK